MNAISTYNFTTAKVKVIDCSSETCDFRVAEVYDSFGKFVHEIRTSSKGRLAAELAYIDALHLRLV